MYGPMMAFRMLSRRFPFRRRQEDDNEEDEPADETSVRDVSYFHRSRGPKNQRRDASVFRTRQRGDTKSEKSNYDDGRDRTETNAAPRKEGKRKETDGREQFAAVNHFDDVDMHALIEDTISPSSPASTTPTLAHAVRIQRVNFNIWVKKPAR